MSNLTGLRAALYMATMSVLTVATDAMCGRWRTQYPEQWLERIGDLTAAVHSQRLGLILEPLDELLSLCHAVGNALREADENPGAVSDALRELDEWEGWAKLRRARR